MGDFVDLIKQFMQDQRDRKDSVKQVLAMAEHSQEIDNEEIFVAFAERITQLQHCIEELQGQRAELAERVNHLESLVDG